MRLSPDNDATVFAAEWSAVASIGRDPISGSSSRHWFDDADLSLRSWFAERAGRRGLLAQTDRNTNVWAWWGTPGPGAVVTGSHLDSVPGGGAFDGLLGVVAGFAAVDELMRRGHRPNRPIAVVGFAEAVGGRFNLPCLGSRLLTGAVDADLVRRQRDSHGVSVAEAAARAGFDPHRFGPDEERLSWIDAFVELHIEQGRALHEVHACAPVAVGSHLAAHGCWRFTFSGEANHAATAAEGRHDPVPAAAATVLAARELMNEHWPATAAVGRLTSAAGVATVIAGQAELWLDVRAENAGGASGLVDAIEAAAHQAAEREGCSLLIRRETFSDEVILDPVLAIELAGVLQAPSIAGAAGHDAGALAQHTAAAMLFVHNPTGISHAPAERAEMADCAAGVHALADALLALT